MSQGKFAQNSAKSTQFYSYRSFVQDNAMSPKTKIQSLAKLHTWIVLHMHRPMGSNSNQNLCCNLLTNLYKTLEKCVKNTQGPVFFY